VLLAFDQQIRTLTIELEKGAPAALPKGMGALSTVVISREILRLAALQQPAPGLQLHGPLSRRI
jgi:hypothetical protein